MQGEKWRTRSPWMSIGHPIAVSSLDFLTYVLIPEKGTVLFGANKPNTTTAIQNQILQVHQEWMEHYLKLNLKNWIHNVWTFETNSLELCKYAFTIDRAELVIGSYQTREPRSTVTQVFKSGQVTEKHQTRVLVRLIRLCIPDTNRYSLRWMLMVGQMLPILDWRLHQKNLNFNYSLR